MPPTGSILLMRFVDSARCLKIQCHWAVGSRRDSLAVLERNQGDAVHFVYGWIHPVQLNLTRGLRRQALRVALAIALPLLERLRNRCLVYLGHDL